MSPTQRTLTALRKDGWLVAVVERWNPHAHIRQDLYGIIDVLAIKGDSVLGIQATSGSGGAARVAKLQAHPSTPLWLSSPYRSLEVWAWRKLKNTGRRKWEPRITRVVGIGLMHLLPAEQT